MKPDEFKVFCEEVEGADRNDWVWYEGYLWISLTKKQVAKIDTILETKECVCSVDCLDGARGHYLPSGILLKIRGSES